jgi:LysM repeat protein
MRAHRSAGKDRSVLWLHGPDADIGVCLSEYTADARDGATGADAGTKPIDARVDVGENLLSRVLTMRREIVADLSKRIASMPRPAAQTPPSAPASRPTSAAPKAPAYEGSYYEHVVESGQNLSMIAKGYDTTVSKIRQANNMKNDMIRVGQKLIIPAEGK